MQSTEVGQSDEKWIQYWWKHLVVLRYLISVGHLQTIDSCTKTLIRLEENVVFASKELLRYYTQQKWKVCSKYYKKITWDSQNKTKRWNDTFSFSKCGIQYNWMKYLIIRKS